VGPKTPKYPKTADNDIEIPDDFELVAEDPMVSPQIFCQVFPFHLMFNRQLKVVQAGKSVSRVIPKIRDDHCNLLDILEAIRPHITISFQSILAHINTIYVLRTKSGVMLEPDMVMRLKVSG
jgi:guanylate cyclase soluble subunit beta